MVSSRAERLAPNLSICCSQGLASLGRRAGRNFFGRTSYSSDGYTHARPRLSPILGYPTQVVVVFDFYDPFSCDNFVILCGCPNS